MAVSFLSRFMYYIINYRKMQEFFRGFFNFIYFFLNGVVCVRCRTPFKLFITCCLFYTRRKLRLLFFANGVLILSDGLYKYSGIAGCKRIRACVS